MEQRVSTRIKKKNQVKDCNSRDDQNEDPSPILAAPIKPEDDIARQEYRNNDANDKTMSPI